MGSKASREELKRDDVLLLTELGKRVPKLPKPGVPRHRALRAKTFVSERPSDLIAARAYLERHDAFAIRIERHQWKDADGERRKFTLARAAVTDMWPMGTHYWVRDNAIIGSRFLSFGDAKRRRVGREILLSALTFMSSTSQLKRFSAIISTKSGKVRKDPGQWPYIFAGIRENLATHHAEPWAHKQDAWQIAALYALEAIEAGRLSLSDLTAKHERFFGLIVPFLIQVRCWRCENSGSWEEIPAVRTSVRAWEHRLIVKLEELSHRPGFAFIEKGYREAQRSLDGAFRRYSFAQAIAAMERKLLREVERDLPFESPRYRRSDPRYREADGALVYLLLLGYPHFFAERAKRSPQWALRLEKKLLKVVLSLQDARSGGIARYGNDSYQRLGFFRNITTRKLAELYGAPSGDASLHFVGRDRRVPKGRKAAWTHFVWQLAAWSGGRYLTTQEPRYRVLHQRFFRTGLSLFTGSAEISLEQDMHGKTRVARLRGLRMPECYIADRAPKRGEVIFPSPHTPLNWATAEMLAAFQVRAWVLLGSKKGKKTLIGA